MYIICYINCLRSKHPEDLRVLPVRRVTIETRVYCVHSNRHAYDSATFPKSNENVRLAYTLREPKQIPSQNAISVKQDRLLVQLLLDSSHDNSIKPSTYKNVSDNIRHDPRAGYLLTSPLTLFGRDFSQFRTSR